MEVETREESSGINNKACRHIDVGDTLFFQIIILEFGMYTFRRNLQLSALHDGDRVGWLVTFALWHILDLVDNIIPFEDFAEDHMTTIEPRSYGGGNEELGSIGVFAGICHAEYTLLRMLQLEVLVWEFVAIDRFASSAVTLCEISTLDHKVLDDSMERRAFVSKALLAGRQGSEVLGSLERISILYALEDI